MNDFWAKALGNPAGNTATGVTTHHTHPQPAQTWTPGLPPAYSPPVPQTNSKAASSFSTARCPECASGNYKTGGNTMSRCYDCGYNPRQVSTTNNYQPSTVIGRIDG
jgi:hypothetical protein